jgi:hypothetical protein
VVCGCGPGGGVERARSDVMRGRRVHADELVRRGGNGRGRGALIGRRSSCGRRGGGCEEDEDRDGPGGVRPGGML